MKLSIIVIGDEILLGQVVDTNSGFISRMLNPMGWATIGVKVVGDSARDISQAVADAMQQSDLVITTGGLGPTKDDITKGVLLQIFGGELVRDAAVTENIKQVFEKRGIQLNALTLDQALVPSTCRVLQNRYGTAPVMWFERDGKVLISMPGVPFETEGMMRDAVAEQLRQRFSPHEIYAHHTVLAYGIPESALAQRLSAWEEALPAEMHLAYLPVPGYIRLRLDGCGTDAAIEGRVESKVAELKSLLDENFLWDGDATPAEIVLSLARSRGWSIGTAESCTGGNIAHAITSIAGSSDCYMGSVVSYANSVKHNVLGVSMADIEQHGAVSQEVVEQMTAGACQALGCDCAVATSGVAGPGGGTPDKPVGTVWMCARIPGHAKAVIRRFPGNRSRVIDRATTEALLLLASLLSEAK